jgi:prepilin-type N-terminal cleavage/methylation domain-containing protein
MHVKRRIRGQQGFTLIEVLVAMSILGIVMTGAMTLIQVVLRQSRGVVERTDAMQRGRLALDDLTRQIRSQVCLNATTPGFASATASDLTFYSDFSDSSASPAQPPVQRRVYYDAAAKQIKGVYSKGVPGGGPGVFTFPTVTESKVILSDAALVPIENPDNPAGRPLFQYFAYTTGTPPLTPTVPLTNLPLSADDLSRTALIKINFVAYSNKAKDDTFATRMEDQVFLRTADPNATKPDPTCR